MNQRSARSPSSPFVRQALRQYLWYWSMLLAALVVPVAIGVPWVDEAIARWSGAAALAASLHGVVTFSSQSRSFTALLRYGVVVVPLVLVMMMVVATVYVARHGAAVPEASGDTWMTVFALSYFVAVHVPAVRLARARAPLAITPELKA